MRSYRFRTPGSEAQPHAPVSGARLNRWPAATAKIIAGLVAGSGILNLVSLMGGPIPTEEPALLRGLFPLDFAGFSRTLTLLAGFALILAAIYLLAQKRRAWQLSLALAGASVAFHLTKGWDLEEAIFSTVIALLLWVTRRQFLIGSSSPPLGTALLRATSAYLIAGIYGAAGFWLLEPAEFHHNFQWWDSAIRTLRLMLFLGDRTLVPNTPYAVWFLDSLFWISAAAFLYSGFVLFRPVAYRFRANWPESALAQQIAAQYGCTAQDYFKHWPDKSIFFSSGRQSFLGYRVAGSYALVLGDPVGPENNLAATVDEFISFCEKRGWRVGFHQVGAAALPVYEALGFRKLKVGDDAIVDLSGFSLTGSAMKEFRNTVNRLDRLGYRVERFDPPQLEALIEELKRISDEWLEIPGHRERHFTLGLFEREYVQSTPVYIAFDGGNRALAFLNLVPSYDPSLATVDLMRRSGNGVNGLMDFLFAKVFLDLKQHGVCRFSLGMAPLSSQKESISIGADEKVAHWVMKQLPFLFRADSLRRFKAKYADTWEPRYAVYRSRLDLPRLGLALRRVTERPIAAVTQTGRGVA